MLMRFTGKLGIGKSILIDDTDADLADAKWHMSKSRDGCQGYPRNGKNQYLHRVVARRMGIVGSIDHRNGDKHDSRRSNIRKATPQENNWNTGARLQYGGKAPSSRYCGVSWRGEQRKWEAYIRVDGRKIHLGRHDSEKDAAEAYNRAAEEHHGEFARLNLVR